MAIADSPRLLPLDTVCSLHIIERATTGEWDNNFFMVFTRTSSARHRLRLTEANFIYEYFARIRMQWTYICKCRRDGQAHTRTHTHHLLACFNVRNKFELYWHFVTFHLEFLFRFASWQLKCDEFQLVSQPSSRSRLLHPFPPSLINNP